jgi:eukaryotic-like serine/threonine-protein kinase
MKPSLPFVGRESELHQLHQAFQSVINSCKPKLVLIQADYGVGKTVLVEHFLAEISSQNPTVLIGRGKCSMENEPSGLIPFGQLFTSLTNQGARQLVFIGDLYKFAKDVAPAWLDIVTAWIAGATVKTIEATRNLLVKNTFSQENVFVQFTNAISRLAEKYPVIAFIDDLHWADASSLGLVFHLVRNLHNRKILFNPSCYQRKLKEDATTKRATFSSKPLAVTA